MPFYPFDNLIIQNNMDSIALFESNGNQLTWNQLHTITKKYAEEINRLNANRIALYLQQDAFSVALLLATNKVEDTDFILIPHFYNSQKIGLEEHQIEYLIQTNAKGSLEIRAMKHDEPSIKTRNMGTHICVLTSGTTGRPKVGQHTWESLTRHVNKHVKFIAKKSLSCYPLAHFAGLQVFTQVVANAGTLIIPHKFDAITIYQAIMQYQPNYINCTPTLIRQLLHNFKKSDFESVKIKNITLGGETVDQNTIDLIKEYLPDTHITHIYASTELGAIIHIHDENEGFPAAYVDNEHLKIADNKLFIRKTECSMKGYLGKDNLNETEWIDSKDIVETVHDRVYFRGREDDIINVGGFKVSPILVEQIIKEVQAVNDVVVIGEENVLVGNLIKAIVVADPDKETTEITKEIITHCRENLAYYMIPTLFEFTEKIPHSMMHKKLRKKYEQ